MEEVKEVNFYTDEKQVFLEIYILTKTGLSFEEASVKVMEEVRENISAMQEILKQYENNPEFKNRYNEYAFNGIIAYIKNKNIATIKVAWYTIKSKRIHMKDIDTIISLNIGQNFALLSAVVLLFILSNKLSEIKTSIDRQNELKEKELKAKYPDMDIQ